MKTFDVSVKSLDRTRERLENYDRDATLNKRDFELLQRDYSLGQVRYWLLAEQVKKLCDTDTVTVLYFFSDEATCPDCDEQSFVLTYLKRRFEDRLLNFVFDERLTSEPMIGILKSTYNITEFPAIIIGGRKFEGFQSRQNLLDVICPLYEEPFDLCLE